MTNSHQVNVRSKGLLWKLCYCYVTLSLSMTTCCSHFTVKKRKKKEHVLLCLGNILAYMKMQSAWWGTLCSLGWGWQSEIPRVPDFQAGTFTQWEWLGSQDPLRQYSNEMKQIEVMVVNIYFINSSSQLCLFSVSLIRATCQGWSVDYPFENQQVVVGIDEKWGKWVF